MALASHVIAHVIKVPVAEGPHPLRSRMRGLHPSGWGPSQFFKKL